MGYNNICSSNVYKKLCVPNKCQCTSCCTTATSTSASVECLPSSGNNSLVDQAVIVDVSVGTTTACSGVTTYAVSSTPAYSNLNASNIEVSGSLFTVTPTNQGAWAFKYDKLCDGEVVCSSSILGTVVTVATETVTTLTAVLNTAIAGMPRLIITYVNEDGTNPVQVVDLSMFLDDTDTDTNTTYTLTAGTGAQSGNIVLTDSEGAVSMVDICALIEANCPTGLGALTFEPTTNILTFTNTQGDTNDIQLIIPTITDTVTGNLIGNFNFGTTITPFYETVTSLSLTGGDTLTFTNEEGVANMITIPADVITTLTNTLAGNLIGRYTSEDGTVSDIDESITTLSYDNGTTVLSYLNEQGNTTTIDLSALTTDIYVNGGTYNSATMELTLVDNDTGTPDIVIDLSTLQSIITNTISGNLIATHNDGTGTAVNIDESITTLVQSLITGGLTYTQEGGTTQTASIISTDVNNDITVGTDGGAYLNLFNTETVTTLVGTVATNLFTYTNENSVDVNFRFDPTDCIDINTIGTGTNADPYITTIDPILDVVTPRNELVCTANGLFGSNAKAFRQDNTGGDIPLILVNPTGVTNPVDGDIVIQEYDDGIVISTHDGATWTNFPVEEGGTTGDTNYAENDLTANSSHFHTWADNTLVESFANGTTTLTATKQSTSLNIAAANALGTITQVQAGNGWSVASSTGTNIGVDGDEIQLNFSATSEFNLDNDPGAIQEYFGSNGAATPPTWQKITEAIQEDNTGADIPVTLTDPTVIGAPVNGDVVIQEYDNGIVISTYEGGVWNNTALYTWPPALDEYEDDVAAGIGGVAIGKYYELNATNLYGLPQGIPKKRIV